ncbi:MAG: DUF2848 family protein [Streptosporangiales bacterium]|nr:DUF2848 family protein [Streptosporangiales bacterium]MBO0890102.1 DUF2848 family protein [Acidothermales bacterium]
MTDLELRTVDGTPVPLRPDRVVVAGYTGRDEASVRAHIDELAAIGIPPPPTVPMFYEMPSALATTADVVDVAGEMTSGEVEPVLVRTNGRWYLGVGSDHTDRELEREDVATAKVCCPKPLGTTVLPLSGDPAAGAFDEHWDGASASAEADGVAYQDGDVAALRTPSDLLPRLFAELDGADEGDLVVFTGTLPLIGGTFRAAASWRLALTVPAGEGAVTLTHSYDVKRRTADA